MLALFVGLRQGGQRRLASSRGFGDALTQSAGVVLPGVEQDRLGDLSQEVGAEDGREWSGYGTLLSQPILPSPPWGRGSG